MSRDIKQMINNDCMYITSCRRGYVINIRLILIIYEWTANQLIWIYYLTHLPFTSSLIYRLIMSGLYN